MNRLDNRHRQCPWATGSTDPITYRLHPMSSSAWLHDAEANQNQRVRPAPTFDKVPRRRLLARENSASNAAEGQAKATTGQA